MNIFGNIKKVIGYSDQNQAMGQSHGYIQGVEINQSNENNNTINLLKEESKFLKEKYNSLLKENELLKQSILSNTNQNDSQITKIFNEFKTAFFSAESSHETNKSIKDFKNFLLQNMLLYNSIDEEDVDLLNGFNITESDWNNNKEIFLFKQNILERNYNTLMENLVVCNEVNDFIKKNDLISEDISRKSSNIIDNNYNNYNSSNIKDDNSNNVSKILNNNSLNLGNLSGKINEKIKKEEKNILLEKLILKEEEDLTIPKRLQFSNINDQNQQTNEILKKNQKKEKQSINFDQLLDPEIDFGEIKKTLDIEKHKEKEKNTSNSTSSLNLNLLNKSHSLEISNLMKTNISDYKKNLIQISSNLQGNVKKGRIKSPLDEEDFEVEEDNIFDSLKKKNIDNIESEKQVQIKENTSTEKSTKYEVNKQILKMDEKIHPQKQTFENVAESSLKSHFKSNEKLNFNDQEKIPTPFNTPINNVHNNELKTYPNLNIGNITSSLFQHEKERERNSISSSNPNENQAVNNSSQKNADQKLNPSSANLFSSLLLDAVEQSQTPLKISNNSTNENQRNSIMGSNLNLNKNAANLQTVTRNSLLSSNQPKDTKKKNIWDDEEMDDF